MSFTICPSHSILGHCGLSRREYDNWNSIWVSHCKNLKVSFRSSSLLQIEHRRSLEGKFLFPQEFMR